jgi:hypothetical protein
MSWSQARQRIYCDDDVFTHEGPIVINPSHECAHLLIAANGGMPWKPEGEKDSVRIAEYTASVLEHLLDETFRCLVYSSTAKEKIIPTILEFARWFVEENFKPFPMSAQKAIRYFCEKVNRELIVRLSPYFLRMRRDETRNPRAFKIFMATSGSEISLTFGKDDRPVFDEEIGKIQAFFGEQLSLLATSTLAA